MLTSNASTARAAEEVASATPKLRYLVMAVLAVWTLSIPFAEIIFRLLGERTTTDLVGLYQSFGKNGGYKLSPNVRADADTLVGRFSVLTNDLGLRCGKQDLRRSSVVGNLDILVLGDSQAYGEGLDYEDTIVGQLASLASQRRLIVNNAAVGGHYLENQFELARWLDDQGVRPKHILVLLTPYLIATAGHYNHVFVGSDGVLYDKESTSRHHLTRWLKRRTVIYARVRNAVNSLRPPPKADLTPSLVKFYSRAEQTRYQEQLLQFLARLSCWCAERQITIMLVYTPGVVEFNFGPVVQAGRSIGIDVDRDVPYRAAHSAAAMLQIPIQDPRPVIECESLDNHPLALRDEAHYSAPVSTRVARNIWEAFKGGAPVAQCASPSHPQPVARHY